MKKGWIYGIIGAVVLFIVVSAIKVSQWSKKIQYGVANGVKLIGLSGKNVKVLIPLWIFNPTPFSMVISKLDLDIYFNGYYVSKIQSKSNYKIQSKANSTYPLEINVRPMDIIKLLADQGTIIDQGNWLERVEVKVKGKATIDLGLFTLRNFNIELKDSLKYYVG